MTGEEGPRGVEGKRTRAHAQVAAVHDGQRRLFVLTHNAQAPLDLWHRRRVRSCSVCRRRCVATPGPVTRAGLRSSALPIRPCAVRCCGFRGLPGASFRLGLKLRLSLFLVPLPLKPAPFGRHQLPDAADELFSDRISFRLSPLCSSPQPDGSLCGRYWKPVTYFSSTCLKSTRTWFSYKIALSVPIDMLLR